MNQLRKIIRESLGYGYSGPTKIPVENADLQSIADALGVDTTPYQAPTDRVGGTYIELPKVATVKTMFHRGNWTFGVQAHKNNPHWFWKWFDSPEETIKHLETIK